MYPPADRPGMGTEGEAVEESKGERGSARTTGGGSRETGAVPHAEPDAGEGGAEEEPWHADRQARVLVAVDLVIMLAVVAGTTELLDDALGLVGIDASPLAVTVPWHVYAFALLGGAGYVFTMLICYDASPGDVFDANLRVPAALPLAAGIYLRVVQLLGEVPTDRLLAGLAFVTGLYVNRAYERIGDLADRLLAAAGPTESGSGDDRESGDSGTGDQGGRADARSDGGADAGSGDEADATGS